MKFIAGLRVWGNWEIGENVLKVFLRLRGSANRRVDLFLPLIASISGRLNGAGVRRTVVGGADERRGQETLAERVERRTAGSGDPRRTKTTAGAGDPRRTKTTAGSGDPRRTKTFGRPNGGVGRPSPNKGRTAGSADPRRTCRDQVAGVIHGPSSVIRHTHRPIWDDTSPRPTGFSRQVINP